MALVSRFCFKTVVTLSFAIAVHVSSSDTLEHDRKQAHTVYPSELSIFKMGCWFFNVFLVFFPCLFSTKSLVASGADPGFKKGGFFLADKKFTRRIAPKFLKTTPPFDVPRLLINHFLPSKNL